MPTLKFLASPESEGQRLDVFLANLTEKSRTVVQEHLKRSCVFINSRSVSKGSIRIHSGDEVSIELSSEPDSSLAPVPGPLDILFEDESLLVLNKSQGTVVHPASGHRGDTLVHHLLHYLGQSPVFSSLSPTRPGIVHRLDKGTSGVLLVAKNREVQESLSEQFKNREVKKIYECIVWGQILREGKLRNAIGRDRIHRKKMSSKTQKARSAETHFKPISGFRTFTHLEVSPLTGRTHQIRVHLSEFGHSILGDPLYGKGLTAKRSESLSPSLLNLISQLEHPFLHAASLTFTHPLTKSVLQFQAPKPKFFLEFLEALQKENAL